MAVGCSIVESGGVGGREGDMPGVWAGVLQQKEQSAQSP